MMRALEHEKSVRSSVEKASPVTQPACSLMVRMSSPVSDCQTLIVESCAREAASCCRRACVCGPPPPHVAAQRAHARAGRRRACDPEKSSRRCGLYAMHKIA